VKTLRRQLSRLAALTYRKHKGCLINERRFVRRRAKLDGHWVTYDLHDQPVRLLNGRLRLRQITRLCESGLQTQIMTSRWDLRDIEVAYREEEADSNFLALIINPVFFVLSVEIRSLLQSALASEWPLIFRHTCTGGVNA
jgi:hypothetical protein